VRQQYNWFQLDDPAIHWFDVSRDIYQSIKQSVKVFVERTTGKT
jgi:hypothetical protein